MPLHSIIGKTSCKIYREDLLQYVIINDLNKLSSYVFHTGFEKIGNLILVSKIFLPHLFLLHRLTWNQKLHFMDLFIIFQKHISLSFCQLSDKIYVQQLTFYHQG